MRRLLFLAAFAAATVAAVGPTPVSAHGEDGVFTGTEATPGSGLSVNVRARLVYVNDNEAAPGAFLIVDAVDAAGMSTPPALLTDNRDGTYQGVLVLRASGAWTLRFRSTTPNAAADVAYTAPEPVGPTSPPSTTTSSRPDGSGAGDDDDGDGGGAGALVVIVVVIGVAAFAAGGWLLWRRGGRDTS